MENTVRWKLLSRNRRVFRRSKRTGASDITRPLSDKHADIIVCLWPLANARLRSEPRPSASGVAIIYDALFSVEFRRALLHVGWGAQALDAAGEPANHALLEKCANQELLGKCRYASGASMSNFAQRPALTQRGKAYTCSLAGRSS